MVWEVGEVCRMIHRGCGCVVGGPGGLRRVVTHVIFLKEALWVKGEPLRNPPTHGPYPSHPDRGIVV